MTDLDIVYDMKLDSKEPEKATMVVDSSINISVFNVQTTIT